MKDAIDKRNERERIARSIVKRRNIVYTSKEELEQKQEEQKKEERARVEELVKQLKAEEDRKKVMEIQRLLAEQQVLEQQLKTGMDATGKKPMDEVMQERVEAILSEKSRKLQDIIAANFVEMEQKNTSVEVSVSKKYKTDGPKTETIIENEATADAKEDMQEESNAQGEAVLEVDIPEKTILEADDTEEEI